MLKGQRVVTGGHAEYRRDCGVVPAVAEGAALPSVEDRQAPVEELPLEARAPIIRKAPNDPSPDEKAKHCLLYTCPSPLD